MNLTVAVFCPRCGGDLRPGPGEHIADRISRLAVACECGYGGIVTATLCETAKGRLDHVQERLDVG